MSALLTCKPQVQNLVCGHKQVVFTISRDPKSLHAFQLCVRVPRFKLDWHVFLDQAICLPLLVPPVPPSSKNTERKRNRTRRDSHHKTPRITLALVARVGSRAGAGKDRRHRGSGGVERGLGGGVRVEVSPKGDREDVAADHRRERDEAPVLREVGCLW